MKFKRLLTALLSATMIFSLAACSGNEKPAESESGKTADAVHVNLAESWGFEFFYTIITPEVSSSTGYDITYYLTSFYDTLVTYNENNELVGSLAESWSMSDDGKVYTFKIKEGIKFSDGSDLTAEDVAKSLMAVPVNLGQYNGSYGRLSTIIESAEATDDYTVELRLTQPYYNTLRELCLTNPFGIVSSEQFDENLKAKDTFKTATYGTGPYMYEGDNDGQTWNFVRNPNYWGEEPDVDTFSIKNIPDNDAKILALKNGEIDFISGIKNISAESYEEISQIEGYGAKIDEKSLQTYYVGYNLNNDIFGDQVIREAISSAIDKDAVVDSIYGGLHGKADTFFSRDLPYCDVDQKTTAFDIDAANKLLDEAGYTDTDGDGIREKNGTKLSADFLYQTGSASDDNLVVYICDQAKKIGIELSPNSAAMMDWYAMVQSGEYGLTIFKTQGGYYDPANVVTNINPQTSMDPILMLVGTTRPEMADLVTELDSCTDETRIQEIYDTILTTMADQNLTTPLVYMHQLAIYSDKIADYNFPMDSNFTSIQNIKIK